MLYVNTVSDEGRFFVTEKVIEDEGISLAEYVQELFPTLDAKKVGDVVKIYNEMGRTTTEQAISVMGDSKEWDCLIRESR